MKVVTNSQTSKLIGFGVTEIINNRLTGKAYYPKDNETSICSALMYIADYDFILAHRRMKIKKTKTKPKRRI